MAKVVLRKEVDDNFGFSIADALFESGVYVKRVRRGGPAEVAGVKRFDKILLVNGMSAKEATVDELLPLFDACERALELTICRYDPLMDEERNEELMKELEEKKTVVMKTDSGEKMEKEELDLTDADDVIQNDESDDDVKIKEPWTDSIHGEVVAALEDLRIE